MLYRTRGGNLEEISGPVAWQTKTRTTSSTAIEIKMKDTHTLLMPLLAYRNQFSWREHCQIQRRITHLNQPTFPRAPPPPSAPPEPPQNRNAKLRNHLCAAPASD